MRATRSAADLLVGSNSGRPGSASSGGFQKTTPRSTNPLCLRKSGHTQTSFDINAMTRFEFGHACGEHGLEFEGTIVKRVDSQAKKMGVRPGWKIYVVDNHVCRSDDDIFLRLTEAKWQWRTCVVYFCTDMALIRAEQARARAAMIQAEMERVAKLPFEGASDNRHIAQLKEQFSFQGTIDKVADRAITPAQLQRVINFAKGHCHRWRDCAPKDVSRTAGQKLHIDFMNLYHVNYWVILPTTLEKQCSFIEMLTATKQPAKWFVVHYWGERILDFTKCLEHHAKMRAILPDDQRYWVSAYANRQHLQNIDYSDYPTKTSFYRAMVATNFQLVVTLDPSRPYEGPCTPFTRMWCNFEIAQCLDYANTSLDLVMCKGKTFAAITRGLTQEEEALEKSKPGEGWKAKSDREKLFNPDMILYGLGIAIETNETMDAKDAHRILNCISKRDLSLPPLEKSDSFTKLNKRLQALIALTCWRRVFSATDTDMQTLQLKLMDTLKNDPNRTSLELSLAHMAGFEEKLGMVLKTLSPSLKELKLNLQGTTLADERLALLASVLPAGLESVALDLSHNQTITNIGLANFSDKLNSKVKEQKLSLADTGVSKELAAYGDDLDGMRSYIKAEAEKGAMCTTINLLPSATRRMVMNVERSKC